MRILHTAALVVAVAILGGSVASAQSLAEAAAREREKRKGKTSGPTKVITEEELRQAGAAAGNAPVATIVPEAAAKEGAAKEGAKPGEPAKAKEKTPDEIRAEQETAWRERVAEVQKEIDAYQAQVTTAQTDLNDPTLAQYSPRRGALVEKLAMAQTKLAEAQEKLAGAQEEGRRSGFR